MGALQQMFSSFITAGPSSISDSFFAYVSMLLGGNGTNGTTNNTFIDSSANNYAITRNGSATQGTFTPFSQSGWGISCPTGDNSVIAPSNTAFAFSTGDFCVEAWVNFNVIDSGIYYVLGNANNTTTIGFGINNGFLTSTVSGTVLGTASTNQMSSGTWYHIAFTRASSTYRYFVNGISAFSTTNSTSVTASTFNIGSALASHSLNGFISNVRVVKGSAVYTGNFTPSTTPLTAITNTSLLTAQTNRYKDNSTNNFTFTISGTPSVQPVSPWEPSTSYSTNLVGGSVFCSGTSDYLNVTTPTSNLALSTGDFTIELWFYKTAIGTNHGLYEAGIGISPNLYVHQSNVLEYSYNNGGNTLIGGVTTLRANTWYHVAICRLSGTTTMYLNGVSEGSAADSNNYVVDSSYPRIGGQSTVLFAGYISNLRVVKGTAVYTTTFAPPTVPLTAITNTQLLLSGINTGIYDSASKNNLVSVGSTQVSTSIVKYGTGSIKFNGTTDYLTVPSSTTFVYGTGNFTIEMWVYITTTGTSGTLYDGRPASTNGVYPTLSFGTTHILNYFVSSSNQITGTTALSINTWYHVALCRAGTSTKLFLNGVQEGSTYTDTNVYLNGTARPIIGSDGSSVGTVLLPGYIDDLRITNGVARYTTTFTPPTALPTQ